MRAKAIIVAVVVFGLVGAVGFSASAAERAKAASDDVTLTSGGQTATGPEVMMRRGDDKDHGKRHGHKKEAECIAFEKVLVGPVCVEIGDILSNILTN
jgi:hypothetical protein